MRGAGMRLNRRPVSLVSLQTIGARMRVRARLFVRVALGAAVAVLAGALAKAATPVPGQDEMNIVDQPGYQPTPEEEQLTGAYEKQEVFFRTTETPGTASGTFSWQ